MIDQIIEFNKTFLILKQGGLAITGRENHRGKALQFQYLYYFAIDANGTAFLKFVEGTL